MHIFLFFFFQLSNPIINKLKNLRTRENQYFSSDIFYGVSAGKF